MRYTNTRLLLLLLLLNYDYMLSRFHRITERNVTDVYGRTEGQIECYINIARQCADAR